MTAALKSHELAEPLARQSLRVQQLVGRIKCSPLAWFIRKTAWRVGLDVCSYPNIARLLRECDTVIDAGANRGDTRDWMRQLGYQGRIWSFEPVPELFKRMERRWDTQWERRQLCLSDVEQEVDFHVRGAGNLETSGLNPNSDAGRVLRVKTVRLDSFFAHLPAQKIFLKTDCEGHDLAIVKGAGKLFPRIKTVLMEVATQPRYKDEPEFAATVAEMRRMGFGLSCFLGNLFESGNRRAGSCDVIFESINSSNISS